MRLLNIKKNNKPFQVAAIVINGNLLQREIILQEDLALLHDQSTSIGTEIRNNTMFGQENSKLYELPVDLLDSEIRIFIECILDRHGHILVE